MDIHLTPPSMVKYGKWLCVWCSIWVLLKSDMFKFTGTLNIMQHERIKWAWSSLNWLYALYVIIDHNKQLHFSYTKSQFLHSIDEITITFAFLLILFTMNTPPGHALMYGSTELCGSYADHKSSNVWSIRKATCAVLPHILHISIS